MGNIEEIQTKYEKRLKNLKNRKNKVQTIIIPARDHSYIGKFNHYGIKSKFKMVGFMAGQVGGK